MRRSLAVTAALAAVLTRLRPPPRSRSRRPAATRSFQTLDQAGIKRKDLYLATDLADGHVSGSAPTYRVTQVIETPNDPRIVREVRGTFTVRRARSAPRSARARAGRRAGRRPRSCRSPSTCPAAGP